MACGGCAKRRAARSMPVTAESIKGGYKYLTDKQLRARLEVYKKNNCSDCEKRYECNWGMFMGCKKHK